MCIRDRAIDLLDEACACAALRNLPMAEYDRLTAELEKMRQDEDDITNDGGEIDYEALAKLRYEISQADEKAVSYTHLDVYKRQGEFRGSGQAIL